jgi:hypothetical protein
VTDVVKSDSTPEAEAEAMAALDRARLPVATLAEAVPHLRRPFTPEAIRFKVQSVFKKKDGTPIGCLIVAYIDQRLVAERLNRVIPQGWSARYEFIPGSKLAWCHMTVDGVTRSDVGESTKGMSKDLVSDALKRAAVPFGVGVSLYALPEIKVYMRDARGRVEERGAGDKRTIILTDYGHETLREAYTRWLETHGVRRFGAPLDHGDVVGATLDEDPVVEETGLAVGDGDGSGPGWKDVDPAHVERIEAVLARAAEVEFPGFADRATTQMRMVGQSFAANEEFVAAAEEQIAAIKRTGAEA